MQPKLSERLAKYLGPIHPDTKEAYKNLLRVGEGESVQSVYLADRPGPVNAEYYEEAIRNRIERDLRTIAFDHLAGLLNATPQTITSDPDTKG